MQNKGEWKIALGLPKWRTIVPIGGNRTKFLLLAAASVMLVGQASASVFGTVTENACGGGGVTVTATTITWLPPSAGDSTRGCDITGAATGVFWSGGGSLGPGVTGAIKNLTSPGPPSVDQFMVWPWPGPVLDYVLTGLGPGSPNVGAAACAAASSNAALTCSVVPGSPFILNLSGTSSTSVTLAAFGTVADPNNPSQISNWLGGFSVTIAGSKPIDVYNQFVSLGNITTGQQGQFTATATPEPGTITMLLVGGALIAVSLRTRRNRG
jgi:hypothetical protein